MRRLIENGWILCMDEAGNEYPKGQVVLEDDEIVYVGETILQKNIDEIIDAQGMFVLPGMINVHVHPASIPLRLCEEKEPDLIATKGSASLIYLAAKYGIAELLHTGITTFVDAYSHMDQIAMACEELGIRALLGERVDHGGEQEKHDFDKGLALAESFLQTWQDSRLITPILALSSWNKHTKSTLPQAMRLAVEYDTMIQLPFIEEGRDNGAESTMEWLDSHHCLNEHVLAIATLPFHEFDLSLLKRRGVSVAYCSSIHRSQNLPSLSKLKAYGIPTGLGSGSIYDHYSFDMFSQMRLLLASQQWNYPKHKGFGAYEALKMATLDGAKALHLDHAIGSLEPCKKGDMILVDAQAMSMFPMRDPYTALVYGGNPQLIQAVFVDGVPVLQMGRSNIDEIALREELEMEIKGFF